MDAVDPRVGVEIAVVEERKDQVMVPEDLHRNEEAVVDARMISQATPESSFSKVSQAS